MTLDSFLDTSVHILRDGACVAFVPTLITSPLSTYEHNLPIIADAIETWAHPGILGIHLEGPFISKEPGAIGCHPPEHTRLPSVALLQQWQQLARGKIVLLTIAAELHGSAEVRKLPTFERF